MPGEIGSQFLALARRILPRPPVLCDVGSRDAAEAINLRTQLGGVVHVFEPNPVSAEICRGNLEAAFGAGSASWFFNEVAVSDREGSVPFYPVNMELSVNKDPGFSSLFRINPAYTKRRGRIHQDEITVRSTTLDAYFRGKRPPDLLWVDVEGAELLVLRGAENVLARVRLIHLEVSFRPMQLGKPLFREVHQFLEARGFTFFGFTGISAAKAFLYMHRLLPNPPWRLNAVFYRQT